MKLRILAAACVITGAGMLAAQAQTVIEERSDHPAVVVPDRPASSVTVEQHSSPPAVEKKSTTVETSGSGDCTTKTVHKENETGSKTVKKTNCE